MTSESEAIRQDPAQANVEEAVRGLFRSGWCKRFGESEDGGVGVPVPVGPRPIRGGAEAEFPAFLEDWVGEQYR